MTVRRSKFQPPHLAGQRSPESVTERVVLFSDGYNVAVPSHELADNESPDMQNYELFGRGLRKRSGMSSYGAIGGGPSVSDNTGDPAFSAIATAKDASGLDWTIIYGSSHSVGGNANASASSGGAFSRMSTNIKISESTGIYRDTTSGFVPAQGENAIFMASGVAVDSLAGQRAMDGGTSANSNFPSYYTLGAPLSSGFTNIGDFGSFESFGRYVEYFDDRLIFFNMGSSATAPDITRVRWTSRGNPLDFAGGGFEDLPSMKGAGTALLSESDRLVLMSDQEVWEGVPRRDAFAFDFNPVSKFIGSPFPQTAAATDIGVIWLGEDLRFRLLKDNTVLKFNDNTFSDLQSETVKAGLDFNHIWADFNEETSTYMFWYNTTAGGFTNVGFWLRTDTVKPDPRNPNLLTGAWMRQISTGNNVPGKGSGKVIGMIGNAVGNVAAAEFDAETTADNGTDFEAQYTTKAFRVGRPDQYKMATEVWLDHDSNNATVVSTPTVYSRPNNATGYTLEGQFASFSGAGTQRLPFTGRAGRDLALQIRTSGGMHSILMGLRVSLRVFSGKF